MHIIAYHENLNTARIPTSCCGELVLPAMGLFRDITFLKSIKAGFPTISDFRLFIGRITGEYYKHGYTIENKKEDK